MINDEVVIDEVEDTLPDERENYEDIASDTVVEEMGEPAEEVEDTLPDYSKIIEEDLSEIRRAFPEAAGIKSITELENPLRYAALRDLGLSAREAYLATNVGARRRDNRSHLVGGAPRGRSVTCMLMPERDMRQARDLFSGLSDAEIQSLYKKVTFPK